jgi:peroxiredoxin
MIVAISTDKARPLKKLAQKENYNFIIISDADTKISKEYNVFGKPIDYDMMKMELAIPTTYLIDSNGIIVWRYVGNKTDRPSINAILEAIDSKL